VIEIRAVSLRRADLVTRMPFRYGIATMTALPHLFVVIEAEVDGISQTGVAADHLPPKWFTKDAARDPAEEIGDMLTVIRHAAQAGAGLRGATFFDVWGQLDQAQRAWGETAGFPPLLYRFGTALVERALLDAVCRAKGRPFHQLLHNNDLGLRLGELHGELDGMSPHGLLPPKPLEQIFCRHTVGLSDPLRAGDNADDPRDTLPHALESCIDSYGLRHFKIKVTADPAFSLPRLRETFTIISECCGANFRFSVDGNESFSSIAEFREFWEAAMADPLIAATLGNLLFVEQPLHRDVALSHDAAAELRTWDTRPPFIIDESDSSLEALPAALEAGYSGITHKNCKGVVKGIANACLLEKRRRARGSALIMSGEDLANVGPVAVTQDLAVQAALGNASVERNGHHYFAGLSAWPEHVRAAMAEAHSDLYGGPLRLCPLRIDAGMLRLTSVNARPFGCGPVFDDLGCPLDP